MIFLSFFFFRVKAPSGVYASWHTLPRHDARPFFRPQAGAAGAGADVGGRTDDRYGGMAAAHGGLRFLDCARRSRRAWMADWRRLGPTVRWRRRLRRTLAGTLPDDGAGPRVRTGELERKSVGEGKRGSGR